MREKAGWRGGDEARRVESGAEREGEGEGEDVSFMQHEMRMSFNTGLVTFSCEQQ